MEISPNLQRWYSCGQRWTDWILSSIGQRLRSQRDHTWSNKHFERHLLNYLQNAWTCFNESYHIYWLSGPHYTGNIFKSMDSKVKFTDNIVKNAFPDGGLKSTVCCWRPSSLQCL